MVGTFIGPGGIYMMISGSMTIVFGFSAIESLIYNLIPLGLFCVVRMKKLSVYPVFGHFEPIISIFE